MFQQRGKHIIRLIRMANQWQQPWHKLNKAVCFLFHLYIHAQVQGIHGGKRKGFMAAYISCFKINISMAKQRPLPV